MKTIGDNTTIPGYRLIVQLVFFLLNSVLAPGISFGQDNVNSATESGVFPGGYERVFIHSDRDIYISGERVWFNLFLLDDQNSLSADGSKIVYIELIDSDNNVLQQTKCLLSDGYGNGDFLIPASAGTGDYLLRLYTSYQRNFGAGSFQYYNLKIFNPYTNLEDIENLSVTNQPQRVINNNSTANSFNIRMDAADSYKTREKVILTVNDETREPGKSSRNANVSLSISVPSRLPGNQSLTEFAGKSPLEVNKNTREIIFNREKTWTTIYGKFLSRDNLQPVSGRLYLTLPGQSTWLYYTDTDSSGNFKFRLPITLGQREFIIQPSWQNDNDYLIRIISPFEKTLLPPVKHPFLADSGMIKDVSGWSVNFQLNKIYSEAELNGEPDDIIDTTNNFYGVPDKRILLKDYVRLPVMQEVFSELFSGVTLKEDKGRYNIIVTDNSTWQKYNTPPAIFLDGIFIHDAVNIANLDPENVKQVDVIKEKYNLGDIVFEGIIDVKTYNGKSASIDPGQSSVRSVFKPFDSPLLFHSGQYDLSGKIKSRIPDLRNTLYWNPRLEFNEKGEAQIEFFTSDFLSDYEIRIEGFDSAGNPVSVTRVFSVK